MSSVQVRKHFLLRSTINLCRSKACLATASAFHTVTAMKCCHGYADFSLNSLRNYQCPPALSPDRPKLKSLIYMNPG